MSQFHAPSPQPNPFVASFEVTQTGESAYLSLTASHVDPNVEQSPVEIYLNGTFFTHLNQYFDEEALAPKTVQIPLDPALLRDGVNEIKILIRQTNLEYEKPNLDDFEFWGLSLLWNH